MIPPNRGVRKFGDRPFLRDGVKFVGVVGESASFVEDLIDEIVVGDGRDETRYILTSSHARETLAEAVRFAEELTGEYSGDVQVVEV
jgi:argininosuccinate synthase